ncbi:MAG: hypothetical protein WCE38_19335 [Burkholderiales bacterium]
MFDFFDILGTTTILDRFGGVEAIALAFAVPFENPVCAPLLKALVGQLLPRKSPLDAR